MGGGSCLLCLVSSRLARMMCTRFLCVRVCVPWSWPGSSSDLAVGWVGSVGLVKLQSEVPSLRLLNSSLPPRFIIFLLFSLRPRPGPALERSMTDPRAVRWSCRLVFCSFAVCTHLVPCRVVSCRVVSCRLVSSRPGLCAFASRAYAPSLPLRTQLPYRNAGGLKPPRPVFLLLLSTRHMFVRFSHPPPLAFFSSV